MIKDCVEFVIFAWSLFKCLVYYLSKCIFIALYNQFIGLYNQFKN